MIVILILGWPSTTHGIPIALVGVHLRVGQLAKQQRLGGCIQVIGIHSGGVGAEAIHGIHDLQGSRGVGLAREAWVEGVDGSSGVLGGLVGRQVGVTSFTKQPCQVNWGCQRGSKG